MDRKEKITKLQAILAGKLSIQKAFPEKLDLSLCTNEELNFLLKVRKKVDRNENPTQDEYDQFNAIKQLNAERKRQAKQAAKN